MGKEQINNFVSSLNAIRRERLEHSLSNTDMKQCEIDWEQRRYEIAKEMLPAIYTCDHSQARGDHLVPEGVANEAVRHANALINELKKWIEK